MFLVATINVTCQRVLSSEVNVTTVTIPAGTAVPVESAETDVLSGRQPCVPRVFQLTRHCPGYTSADDPATSAAAGYSSGNVAGMTGENTAAMFLSCFIPNNNNNNNNLKSL